MSPAAAALKGKAVKPGEKLWESRYRGAELDFLSPPPAYPELYRQALLKSPDLFQVHTIRSLAFWMLLFKSSP